MGEVEGNRIALATAVAEEEEEVGEEEEGEGGEEELTGRLRIVGTGIGGAPDDRGTTVVAAVAVEIDGVEIGEVEIVAAAAVAAAAAHSPRVGKSIGDGPAPGHLSIAAD